MTPESSSAAVGQSGWASAPVRTSFGNLTKAVLIVTAIAGTLDIIAAHLHIWAASGNFPTGLLKGIASGAFGRERAFQGGAGMMAFGAFFHYFISFSFTLVFFLLYPRLSLMRKNIVATGVVYGLCVWFTMNFIVLPLSALHSSTPNFANKHTYIGVCVLIAIFGLPIALCAERFHGQRRK
jgi:hypothetical protein